MRFRHDGSMSLTPWNAFVEVCRTGSLRAAAEATGFTQPGLSRQVAALEREVGVRLLHRGSRGVTPTAAGAALLPHARLLVNEARRGREAARTATDRPATIVLGAVPSATAALVPRAIGRLRDAGGPEVTIASRITPDLDPWSCGRELDAAVVTDAPPGLPATRSCRATHLGDDEVVVIAAPGHRARRSRPDRHRAPRRRDLDRGQRRLGGDAAPAGGAGPLRAAHLHDGRRPARQDRHGGRGPRRRPGARPARPVPARRPHRPAPQAARPTAGST